MSDLFNEARKAADESGSSYRPHPLGEFSAVIESVSQREHNGRVIYEVSARSDKGKAKMSIWETKQKDVTGFLLERAGGDEVKAKENYVKTMSRYVRLYKDLGLADPTDEDQVYERLGEFQGKSCHLVVQANTRNELNPIVYINAPKRKAGSVTRPAASRAGGEPMKGPDFGSSDTDMSDIPF